MAEELAQRLEETRVEAMAEFRAKVGELRDVIVAEVRAHPRRAALVFLAMMAVVQAIGFVFVRLGWEAY